MAYDLDAVLAEIPDEVEAPESPAVEASTESVEPKYAELDALLPDADDVDEDLRGKPVKDAIKAIPQWKHEAKVAAERNQRWNEMESRTRMAEAAVEWAKQQMATQQAPAQRGETDEEFIQRLANKPTEVLPEVINRHVAPIYQELQQTRAQLEQFAADRAQEQARSALGFDPETFEAIKPAIASFMYANQWPTNDPNAWYAAGDRFREAARRMMPQAAPAPVEVPKQSAPPAGAARSQVRPSAGPKLRGRDRENAVDLAAAFGISPDSPAFAQFENEIAGIASRRDT